MGSMEKGSGAQYTRGFSTESTAMRVWYEGEWGREMGSRVNHRLTEELLNAISTREDNGRDRHSLPVGVKAA